MKHLFILLLCPFMAVKASHGQTTLEQYIQEAFSNNQRIHQQQFALEKSMYALREAKTLFLPSVSFHTDYFLAGGGRTVDFPAGTLLNPVYNSLNELTGSNDFPQLENQNILLNPNNFYDTKFRTTLPLLNLEIEYNRRIKQDQINLQQAEVDLYKRELVKEIKTAYFQYLQSVETIKIYETARSLVAESNRINEALFKNDKVNRTTVLRSANEIIKFDALRENAQQQSNSAKAYFNFLLNKKLNEEITIDKNYHVETIAIGDIIGISQREELSKLTIAKNINQHVLGLSKSYSVPKLSTFLDLGSQGFDWQFNNKTRYYFFGVSLQWELFASGKNQHKVKQVQIESKLLQTQTEYVEKQLHMQYITVVNNFNAAKHSHQSAVSTFHTSQKIYSDLLRLYKEGQALFIELLDAQNQLIQSELQVNISLYDTYIKAAEIERANASYHLNK